LVSPLNARKQLAAFIHGAKKELLIYDMKIADRVMTRLLEERAKAGVEVRIIGKVTRKTNGLTVRKLNGMRLHARTIVRDQRQLFIGSQSLRELELDARREIGIIFSDRKIIASVMKVFEADWRSAASPRKEPDTDLPDNTAASTAKKVAKSIARELPPVGPVMEKVLKEVASGDSEIEIDHKELQSTVRDAVRDSVKEAVQEAIGEVANGKESVKDEPPH
jgi:phosphatidylserine/phosphatidylglycerophosphate/cardiolipin synthase-like enzyme